MVRAVLIQSNPSFRHALKDIFDSRYPSIELIVTGNGADAMEKIQTFPPDLALIDIKLPGESSLDLTRKIKNRHPKVMIIMISSYDLPEYREAACRYGADYFISKDSPMADYLSLIKSVLTDRGLQTEGENRGGES